MASMHIHHPLLSVCLCLASLFTFGTELFSGLTGQTYREDFSPFVGTGLNMWGQGSKCEVQQSCSWSAHIWRTPLCITCVSRPIHTGSGGHPHSARCSQLLRTNHFTSIPTATSIHQQNSSNDASAKTCYAWDGVESLSLDGVPAWEAAVITTQGKFLPLLITNTS